MTKQEAMQFMMKSINDDNKDLCQRSGMSESEMELQIAQSQTSLHYIVGNMYDRMLISGLINQN